MKPKLKQIGWIPFHKKHGSVVLFCVSGTKGECADKISSLIYQQEYEPVEIFIEIPEAGKK